MAKRNISRTTTLLITAALLLPATLHAENTHSLTAHANLIGNYNDSSTSWLDSGLSRFSLGTDKDNNSSLLGEVQIAYKYSVNDQLRVQTHIQLQDSSHTSSAQAAGLVELKARYIMTPSEHQRVTLTAGQFFLPVSMENIDRFWESPYTISFSALNSWIGEEFRPIGIDLNYTNTLNSGSRWSIAATAFGGNDSMGAILAWRGWSHGRHRSVYDDSLSLPDLTSLATGGDFESQRNDGSKPFGKDLDRRIGYTIRSSWTNSSTYKINLSWVDNMADTRLHHGEYAWRTQFGIAGVSWFITDDLVVAGETISGNTTMGSGPGVNVDFHSAYLLASLHVNEFRYSARVENFETKDKDLVDNENNDKGHSYTLAIMWNPADAHLSGGIEALHVTGKRDRTLTSETFNDGNNKSISLLVKYAF